MINHQIWENVEEGASKKMVNCHRTLAELTINDWRGLMVLG